MSIMEAIMQDWFIWALLVLLILMTCGDTIPILRSIWRKRQRIRQMERNLDAGRWEDNLPIIQEINDETNGGDE